MNDTKKDEIEEEQAFLSSPSSHDDVAWSQERRSSRTQQHWRLALEVVMGITIIALLGYIIHERVELKRSPVPKFPRKTYKFLPDPNYVRDDMLFSEQDTLNTLHSWLPLSSEARGYVQIANHETYASLGKPYTVAIDRMHDGPAYMVSVFHQLHCLSYVVDHYRRGYGGANLTAEVAHHSAHCFDYLRQALMCAADVSLEGEDDAGPGWGSDHQCADYDAVLAWANENGAMRWRTGLLPGVAIL